jgi:hypothetical protein
MPPITVTPEPVWRNGKDCGVTEHQPWSGPCDGEISFEARATKVARIERISSQTWDEAPIARFMSKSRGVMIPKLPFTPSSWER